MPTTTFSFFFLYVHNFKTKCKFSFIPSGWHIVQLQVVTFSLTPHNMFRKEAMWYDCCCRLQSFRYHKKIHASIIVQNRHTIYVYIYIRVSQKRNVISALKPFSFPCEPLPLSIKVATSFRLQKLFCLYSFSHITAYYYHTQKKQSEKPYLCAWSFAYLYLVLYRQTYFYMHSQSQRMMLVFVSIPLLCTCTCISFSFLSQVHVNVCWLYFSGALIKFDSQTLYNFSTLVGLREVCRPADWCEFSRLADSRQRELSRPQL